MAKLIGTDPNQVPTNADLGTMAYQDAERPALGQTTVKSAGTALIVERTGDASNLQFKSDGQNVGHIYGFKNGSGGDLAFYPTNSSGSITQRMIINRDGNVTINDGNLVLANGHGIDFSATAGTGSSELLDDYEEGTFTPTVSVGGVTNVEGFYTKIGRQVTIHMKFASGFNFTNNETQYFQNLPFASDQYDIAVGSAMLSRVDSANRFGTAYMTSGSRIALYSASETGDFDAFRCIDLNASSAVIYIYASYLAQT